MEHGEEPHPQGLCPRTIRVCSRPDSGSVRSRHDWFPYLAPGVGAGGAASKNITAYTLDRDKYAHILGDVIIFDGMHLNQELVKQGWCWWHRKYAPGDVVLKGLETEARETKKGLWADPQPVPPWEWRKRSR